MAAHPGIEIVTAGTDVPAIVAAVVTGIAAILGIAGTAWQGERGRKAASEDLSNRINAEDHRAVLTEKQRVYSEFQGRLDDVFVAATQPRISKTDTNLREALSAMYRATAAVKLIASRNIGDLARATAQAAADESSSPRVGTREYDSDNKIYKYRQQLYDLMRADLGVDEPTAHGAGVNG